jgi:carboxypeptidase PM20D1
VTGRRHAVSVVAGALVALAVALAAGVLSRPSRQPEPLVFDPPAFSLDSAAVHLARAVRFPTVSTEGDSLPPGAPFEGLRQLLAVAYPRVGERMRRERIAGRSLLLEWPGTNPSLPAVLLLAHQDVVPAEPESAWTVPPFSGRIEDGFVWGRGTLDDKGAMIAMLEAAEALLDAGFVPERTVLFAFGHDEEVGGSSGASAIAETLAARGTRVEFALDEGLAVTRGIVPGVEGPAALVGIAEKGAVSVELTARGEGGHTSIPPRHTAPGRLARSVVALEARPFPVRFRGPARDLFTNLAPEMAFPYRVLFSNLWLFSPLIESRLAAVPATDAVLRTTVAVVRLESGIKENVLPATARAEVNLRIAPGETARGTVDRVRRVAGPGVEVRPIPGGWDPSPVSDPRSDDFALLARVIRGAFPGSVVAPGLVLGATDSRHYAGIAGAIYRFSPITVGPEDLARIHGRDERLPVKDLGAMVRFYAALIRGAAGGPSPRSSR